MGRWLLTALREKLLKIAAEVVTHAPGVIFQMAEAAILRRLFAVILEWSGGSGRGRRYPDDHSTR